VNNDWFTPVEIVEAARKVMGSIDCDPASCDEAQEVVRAKRYYTRETDGLKQTWCGNVWLNPPYSVGECKAFIDRLSGVHAFSEQLKKQRNVTAMNQAIVLVNASTCTQWFHSLLDMSRAMCFFRRRVRFRLPGGQIPTSPRYDNIAFYLAHDNVWLSRFELEFHAFGEVIVL
jgi:ParB family chromosome partitioning protein